MFTKRDAKKLAETDMSGCEVSNALCGEFKQVADRSCGWVKRNPWAGVGVGVALGLVVGVLISKK